jgi:hypothetical protein
LGCVDRRGIFVEIGQSHFAICFAWPQPTPSWCACRARIGHWDSCGAAGRSLPPHDVLCTFTNQLKYLRDIYRFQITHRHQLITLANLSSINLVYHL